MEQLVFVCQRLWQTMHLPSWKRWAWMALFLYYFDGEADD